MTKTLHIVDLRNKLHTLCGLSCEAQSRMGDMIMTDNLALTREELERLRMCEPCRFTAQEYMLLLGKTTYPSKR